jgi:hypothetical protein
MKNLYDYLFIKKASKLAAYASLKINEEEADMLFGGFKEYKLPVYEHTAPKKFFKITELLTDIAHSNK